MPELVFFILGCAVASLVIEVFHARAISRNRRRIDQLEASVNTLNHRSLSVAGRTAKLELAVSQLQPPR